MKNKVLIVDDEPLIRMTLESGLQDLGYQTQSAMTIAEGLAMAEQFSPDAVLLDNRLRLCEPGGGGHAPWRQRLCDEAL